MTKNAQLPNIKNILRRIFAASIPRAFLWPLAEALGWGILGLSVAFVMLALHPAPLSNDSYQYLSVAANIRHGNGAATDLVYFDTERSHGRIPAPLTTFPPGYSAAIGLLSGITGSFETAARILSAIGYAGTAVLLVSVLISARVTPLLRAAVLLLYLTNFVSASFSTAVLTESMFVFVFIASIAALSLAWRNTQHPYGRLLWTVAGMTLAGFSYWIRYAGLFLIAALVLCVVLRFIRLRSRIGASELYAALIPIGMAGALMARNVFQVGTWKGGNDLPVSNPLRRVLADFMRAQLHIFTGEHAVNFGLWEALLLLGSLGLGALLVRVILCDGCGSGALLHRLDGLWLLPFTCAAIYSVGLCYAGLHTVISFGTRMFLPVLPIYLLLLGLVLHWLISRASFRGGQVWFWATLCALVIGYAGVNARDLNMPQAETRQSYLSGLFAERTTNGLSLSDWVNAHIGPTAVIAAQDGQATGYLLQRRALGMVESEYSAERWECPEIRVQMNRFDARYLILYRHPDQRTHLLEESGFAAEAANGQPKCGFVIAAENRDVRILEIGPLPEETGHQEAPRPYD
jgi:hypothetical protein